MVENRLLSSLEKVFLDEIPQAPVLSRASMLRGEVYSLQWALRSTQTRLTGLHVNVEGSLSPFVKLWNVHVVPVELPVYPDHDGFVLRDTPGLYPDLLEPIPEQGFILLPDQWRSVWISLRPDADVPAGEHVLRLKLQDASGTILADAQFTVELLPLELPSQTLRHTQWFHSDCIADFYGFEVFSEPYWQRVEQFMTMAVEHGINMILTPIFTPPLDTAVGGERTTVQLVDVTKQGDSYSFGFDRLTRWINMARRIGVEFFEFAHLFTQWGAKHAPKIMGRENGEEVKLFGWDTDAAGPEYAQFLDQFLPALVAYIQGQGLSQHSYFHISDEPQLEDLESYGKARDMIHRHLRDFPIMDALSNFEFYETGLVQTPIPANNHIEPFLAAGIPNLWTYYCISQYKKVSQRFVCMPSMRNRVLGCQLFKYNIKGFLHWGYNYYNSQYSLQGVNPFRFLDGLHWSPAGDTFLVYPGPDGPLASLRLKVFHEGLQDLRAMQLLASFTSHDAVVNLLEDELAQPLTFSDYPRDTQWLLAVRERVNAALRRYC